MDILIARKELTAKPKKVNFDKLLEELKAKGEEIFYFDRENSHKDLLELQDYFEAKGKSFYMSEVKYGLSDNEYMYQVHIMN